MSVSFSFQNSQLTDCKTLSVANTVYTLQNNINNRVGTCFNITANNVTLNGNGNTIDGDDSGTDYGVYVSETSNATISNITITDFSYGIYLNASSNDRLSSVTANSNGAYGINIYSSSNNNQLTDITANSNGAYGIYLFFSNNSQLSSITTNSNSLYGISLYSSSNNSLSLINSSLNNGEGINLYPSSNNNQLTNINTNSNVYGIRLHSSSNNNQVTNITANSNTYGIYIQDSSSNNLSYGSINASSYNGVYITSLPNSNNIFNNISIANTAASYEDINFATTSINGTEFIDMPNIGKYSFTGAGGTVIVKKTGLGEVRFLKAVNGSGTNFTNDIQIGNNSAYINSSQIGLNRSANITLYGTPGTGMSIPVLKKDGAICSDCYNFTALSAATVIFNVSSAGNYTIGDRAVAIASLNSGWNLFSMTMNNSVNGTNITIPV
ncbi:MAG: right-handed parallel beta-helix repeat-containing protein, partial [Patescibacteria group bacterium]